MLFVTVPTQSGWSPLKSLASGQVRSESWIEIDVDLIKSHFLKLVKEKYQKLLPSITHLDKTARLQTVNKIQNNKKVTIQYLPDFLSKVNWFL